MAGSTSAMLKPGDLQPPSLGAGNVLSSPEAGTDAGVRCASKKALKEYLLKVIQVSFFKHVAIPHLF